MAWRPSIAGGSTKGLSAIRRGMECLWQAWTCSPPAKPSTCSQTIPMKTGCRIVFCTPWETQFPSAHRMMRPFLQTHGMLAAYRFQLRPSRQRYRSSLWRKSRRSGYRREMISVCGYGKLLLRVEDVDSHGDAIAQRRAAGVPCDKLKSFCRMTVRNHRDVVERRHFVFSVVHQLQFNGV